MERLEMRRKDREMPREFALGVVDTCEYAVLSTTDADGSPYGVPLSVAREGDFIYFHCAPVGHKIENLRRQGRVCLSCVGDTHVPEKEFTTEFESAIVFGNAEEVSDEAEKILGLRLICEKYTPNNMDAFDHEIAASLHRTGVWKIRIEEITGKRKKYDSQGREMKFGRME